MNDVLEAKIPAVLGTGHVVETGKSAWHLKVPKKLSVYSDFFSQAQDVFFRLRPEYKDLLGRGICEKI